MRQTLRMLVHNHPGVLAKVAGLYAGRGVNIEGFTVHPVKGSDLSRMVIETSCENEVFAQIVEELKLLKEVVQVEREEEKEEESKEEKD
ncbi:MAG: acetolactate synthase small subunit [Brevibacillus sp.]|nr:acetolactate synthase small subunit [Brevibacillus sp.]